MIIKIDVEDTIYKKLKQKVKENRNEFITGFCNRLFEEAVIKKLKEFEQMSDNNNRRK